MSDATSDVPAVPAPAEPTIVNTTEKWDEGVLAHVEPGSAITVATKEGPVSGFVKAVDATARTIEIGAMGKTKRIVFAAALLLAIAMRPAAAQPGRPLASVKAPPAASGDVSGPPTLTYLTDDGAARHAIETTQTLARAAADVAGNAWTANRTAMVKCEEAAKGKPATPVTQAPPAAKSGSAAPDGTRFIGSSLALPEPRDAASDAAYIAACKGLGVEIPFNPSVVAALGREVQSLYEASAAADYLRLKVKGREADAWRLPATMEPLGARVGQLLAFVQGAKLGVAPEAVAEARKAYGIR